MIVPNGAAGLHLLGEAARASGRHTAAATYFRTALRLDRFLWGSREALCELGEEFAEPLAEMGTGSSKCSTPVAASSLAQPAPFSPPPIASFGLASPGLRTPSALFSSCTPGAQSTSEPMRAGVASRAGTECDGAGTGPPRRSHWLLQLLRTLGTAKTHLCK